MDIKKFKADLEFKKELLERTYVFHSTYGLFSPKEIDFGTELLIKELKIKPTDLSLDLGCGYGAIGLVLAHLSPQGSVHMVDKDFVAVEFAQKNAALNNLPNCKVYLSNGFSKVPQGMQFDNVVSNFPANTGKELFSTIIFDAKTHLKPGGKLYIVTITALRQFVKRAFEEIFGNYSKPIQTSKYTVSVAEKMIQ